MKKRELPKLKELPLLLYLIDGVPKILSLNDYYICKGDTLHRIEAFRHIGDMSICLLNKYDKFCKNQIPESDLISAYDFMKGQLESQKISKEEVYDFIARLTDNQFKELENQVDIFYTIYQLIQKGKKITENE